MKTEHVSCIFWKGNHARLICSDGTVKDILDSPVTWLENQVLVNGSTLQGRLDAFRLLLHVSQKPCILISERSQQLYFPTKGADNPDCQWFLYQDVTSTHRIDEDHTCIITRSGLQLQADVNIRTVRLQLKRCAAYLNLINPV